MQPEDFLVFTEMHSWTVESRPALMAKAVYPKLRTKLKSVGEEYGLEKRILDAARDDGTHLRSVYQGTGIASLFNIADLELLAKAHEVSLSVSHIIYPIGIVD